MEDAKELCVRIGSELLEEKPEDEILYLYLSDEGLSLCQAELKLSCNLTKMLPRLNPRNLNGEMLVKASKFKNLEFPLTAVDATAGFGEDSLLLAAFGYDVTLFEYNPVICALLEDGLRRAADNPALSGIVSRMHVHNADSTQALRNLGFTPDLVLLDPMFPERQKSGLIKKKFQLLQQLESPCSTEEDLMSAAVAASPRRVVVKRPAKGPFLAGTKPSYSITGDSIRYDCIVLR